jgi:hypothetical protein
MSDERGSVRGPELKRWLLVAVLILIGIVLFFRFAPRSEPVAPPLVRE